MHIKYCRIKNFRSIRELKIGFENNFQVLVGLNEAGKSNILKALSFIEPDIVPESDDIRDPRHDEPPMDEAYIRFVFGVEKKETKKIFDSLRPKFRAKNIKHPVMQIGEKSYTLQEFCDYKKEGLYTVDLLEKTKSAQHWGLSGSDYSLSKAWKKVPETWSKYPEFEDTSFKYICIEDYPDYMEDSELEDILLEDINTLVGAEIMEVVKDELFDCIVWRYNENNLLPGRIDIAAFSANPDTCEPLRNIFYLAGYEDIAQTIIDAEGKTNGMRNLLRKLSDNTTNHLRRVWPEYKEISIDLSQNGSVIEAGIEDEFNVYSFDRRSDGFKRFVTFLLMISAKVKAEYLYNTIIIIDEPDIGLHPSGVQFLREELKKISKDNIVVIASHSIFMIDKDRIDRHLIIKKNQEETTVTSSYSSTMLDEEVIYRALGYSLFELLKKRNVVFEGWSDKHTFQRWLESTSANKKTKADWKDVGMVHALGAKDVQRVAVQLENFDREYFIITDADKPSLDWKRRFEGKYKWITYKDLGFDCKETIEDFLNEDYVDRMIMSVLNKEQLDAGVSFDGCTTFNSRLEYLNNMLSIDKEEFRRLKRIIKNVLFENLTPKNINLKDLVDAVDISADNRFQPDAKTRG
ncbi:MAG: AAA family ATPase [Porticoccaceae bacterium]